MGINECFIYNNIWKTDPPIHRRRRDIIKGMVKSGGWQLGSTKTKSKKHSILGQILFWKKKGDVCFSKLLIARFLLRDLLFRMKKTR